MDHLRILVDTDKSSETVNITIALLVLLSILLVALWYYDRRNGYRYSQAAREMIGEWIVKIRSKKRYSHELS